MKPKGYRPEHPDKVGWWACYDEQRNEGYIRYLCEHVLAELLQSDPGPTPGLFWFFIGEDEPGMRVVQDMLALQLSEMHGRRVGVGFEPDES